MSSRYTFGRLSDAQIITLADELLASFSVGGYTVKVGDFGTVAASKNDDGEIENSGYEFKDILSDATYFIAQMSWQAGSNTITYLRSRMIGINPHSNAEILVVSNSAYVDAMEIKLVEANAPRVLGIVQRFINMAPPIVAGPDAQNALDQSQAILNRVSSAVSTLVEHTAERQRALDRTRLEINAKAEVAIDAAKAQAEDKLRQSLVEVAERERAIAVREAELDDRTNTHARREFAAKMANLSDVRLSSNLLSKSRFSFALPIAIALLPIVILVFFIYSEIVHIAEFSANVSDIIKDRILAADEKRGLISSLNMQTMYSQIRIAIQSLGLAALVWFSLRVASARYSLVSSWEQDLHKFRLDTERAGFLVEGDLEARKLSDTGLPDVLLESFSRNLFAGADTHRTADGSEGLGSTLNALLGQAAKVQVGPAGVSVEVEGRGIKRAKKAIAEAQD